MGNSVGVFGFVWKCLEIFDLDGHNLGTVQPKNNKIEFFIFYFHKIMAIPISQGHKFQTSCLPTQFWSFKPDTR